MVYALYNTVKMKLLGSIILILNSFSVIAEEFIALNTVSYHFDRTHAKKLNEVNAGVGYENEKGSTRNMFGVYKNSFRRTTIYALRGYSIVKSENNSVGIVGGLTTGYVGTVSPAVGGIFTVQFGSVGLNITAVPPVEIRGHKLRGFAALQLRFRL